ncbi:SIR2 family protein [Nocardia sp. R16R-3T]
MFPEGVIAHLARQATEGRLAVLVGAGLSIGAGYPGWAKLFEPLATALGGAGTDGLPDDLPTLAEAYEAEFGRNSLIAHLRRELRTSRAPTAAHIALSELDLGQIITTNYDLLLEDAISGNADVVVRDSDLAYTASARTRIIKLCGDIANPETITVTRRDFAVYGSRKPRMAEFVRALLETHELLILGASPGDPEFNMLWDLATAGLGDHKPVGWIVGGPTAALQQRLAFTRGLRTVELDGSIGRTAALAQWLRQLADARHV